MISSAKHLNWARLRAHVIIIYADLLLSLCALCVLLFQSAIVSTTWFHWHRLKTLCLWIEKNMKSQMLWIWLFDVCVSFNVYIFFVRLLSCISFYCANGFSNRAWSGLTLNADRHPFVNARDQKSWADCFWFFRLQTCNFNFCMM